MALQSRLTEVPFEALSPRQQAIQQEIVARRGGINGPFRAWLQNPELADRAQKLGAYCRFDSSLAPKLSELAILVVARHWRAQVEWAVHSKIAIAAGLDEADAAVMLAGGDPDFSDPEMAVVYAYAKELLQTARVGDDLHARAVETLGDGRVVDLVALIGYYGLVALTLNAFNVPVPEGYEAPFAE